MYNSPEEYSKFFDDGNHLKQETIFQFVDTGNNLKKNELEFIREHLKDCETCYENFTKIFDENLDRDETKETFEINVDLASESSLNFIDTEKSIDGIISKEGDYFYLIFVKLPPYFEKKNIRITFAYSNLIIRISSVKLNQRYPIKPGDNINLKELSKVFIDCIVKQPENRISSIIKNFKTSKNQNKTWYIVIPAILISFIIYFLFFPSRDSNLTENPDEVKVRKDVIVDSLVKKESITKIDTLAVNKQNVNRITQISSIPSSSEYKTNYFLDGFVNNTLKSNIIIVPSVGDILKKQITFQWSNLNADTCTIIIVDNKNEEIWKKDLLDSKVTFLRKLNPGLYYWKLVANKKLQAVGKFFVE
jgi:hypothetical protein